MKVEIGSAKVSELKEALANSKAQLVAGAERKLDYLAMLSQYVWVGRINGEIVCAFGVIPPSVLSSTAYLWSVTTEAVEEHKFIFIRYSQRMIEKVHREFPRLIGHANPNNPKSIKWLRWLGAVFGEVTDKGIPFVIERKDNGA